MMGMDNADIALHSIQELTEDRRIEVAAMTLYDRIKDLEHQLDRSEKRYMTALALVPAASDGYSDTLQENAVADYIKDLEQLLQDIVDETAHLNAYPPSIETRILAALPAIKGDSK